MVQNVLPILERQWSLVDGVYTCRGSYCGLQFILQMAHDVQILKYILLHDTFILQWPDVVKA